MLQAAAHAIHFKRILNFGEGLLLGSVVIQTGRDYRVR